MFDEQFICNHLLRELALSLKNLFTDEIKTYTKQESYYIC